MVRCRCYFDRVPVRLDTGDETPVEQSHRETCNINTIVAKARKTGLMPFANALATYGDFLENDDYQSALQKIKKADEAFMSLAPALRAKFENDPAKLLSFLSDTNNKKAAQDLGLIPQKQEVVTPVSIPPKEGV